MGRTVVARGGVGHPEAVLTGMVGPELGVGRDTVGGTEDGLGRPGAELVAGGGGLLSAADDCGATGPTELGAGSGLAAGDGDGDADGVGDGDGVPCCFGTAARVAAAGFRVPVRGQHEHHKHHGGDDRDTDRARDGNRRPEADVLHTAVQHIAQPSLPAHDTAPYS
jgi:hypothetical protein